MNWSNILSDNLAIDIREYRRNRIVSTRVIPPFYMSAYVMDAICFCSHFPNMGWTLKDPSPIHVYHKILWESQFSSHFYKICHGVMLPIYHIIFNKKSPRISEEAKVDIFPWQDGLVRNYLLIS